MVMGLATKTVQDVITDVKRTFGDEAAIQITDTDIIRWTNAAQREILIQNRILRATGTTDIVANQSEYTLSGLDVVAIQSIHYDGRRIDPMSFQEAEEYINSGDPKKTQSSASMIWYEWGGVINLYPVPDTDIPAGLTIYYIKEPPAVTDVGDVLSVPNSYYENVVQFVMSKAYELDEDTENSNFKLGQFKERLDMLAEQESQPSQYTYPRITVMPEDDWYGY